LKIVEDFCELYKKCGIKNKPNNKILSLLQK
jgi:hypothetical protein